MPAQPLATSHCILAIDLGSGGPKVGIVDESGRVLAGAVERVPIQFLPRGGAEQDPAHWWSAISTAAKKVIHDCGVPPDSILAVTCTSQWAVTVPIDERGEPLMNAVHWLDTRGASYNQTIIKGFPSVEGYGLFKLFRWIELTGMTPTLSGIDGLGHILFIKNERPDIYARTWKFLEPMDFINLKLSGRCVASQITAIPLFMMDNRKPDCCEYDPWLLRVSGVDKGKLPELVPNDCVLGPLVPAVAADWGLSPQTVVILSGNDNHTAAIGAGAVADYDVAAILGTSGFLTGHVPAKKTDIFHTITTLPSPLKGRYLIMAETGNTGKVLESFLLNLVYPEDEMSLGPAPADLYARVSGAAAGAPAGSDGLLFLPWFNGSLAPQEDPCMRGGFLNLSHKSTRAHMARAVLEGIAYNWRWLLEPVQKMLGHEFKMLRLGGGGALSDTWAQILADVTGLPIHQLADPRNANVRGAAFLALSRLNLLSMDDVPGRVPIARVFEPDLNNRAAYAKFFDQFRAARKQLKPVFHALNR